MAGQIYTGMTFTASITNADGDVYINCTFNPPYPTGNITITGDGITFINCTFTSTCFPVRTISVPGTGSVLEGGTVGPCSTFGAATVANAVAWSGSAGPESNILGGMYTFSKPLISRSKGCADCSETTGEGAPDAVDEDMCRIQCTDNDAQSTEGNRMGGP